MFFLGVAGEVPVLRPLLLPGGVSGVSEDFRLAPDVARRAVFFEREKTGGFCFAVISVCVARGEKKIPFGCEPQGSV